ncbi:hypothetical protein [Chitinophaga sp. Cy-1792]|uniref:hypothetical protein n=1 Tax=Chitinophaga sp. Cy-1792 TaxID=2608339 RepID=UPI0014208325|nr:hypothetical protein [Chitinophaga sp. Cy-1792]NIG54897.1 hypothetical protein [Chitinophaga sp. Cy-1792]
MMTRLILYRHIFITCAVILTAAACKTPVPVAYDPPNVIPVNGKYMVRIYPDSLQLTVFGDYHLYAPGAAARKSFEKECRQSRKLSRHIICWGKTFVSQYLSVYLLAGDSSKIELKEKNIVHESNDVLFADGVKIIERFTGNNRGDIIAQYTFKGKRAYNLVFRLNYASAYTPEDGHHTQEFIKTSFLNETRAIIKTLLLQIPDLGFNAFELETFGVKGNPYVVELQGMQEAAAYLPKNLTLNERNYLYQHLATRYTFLEEGKQAVELYRKLPGWAFTKIPQDSGYTTIPAKDYILQRAKEVPALFFNEVHVDVRTRIFLQSLLPDLKKLGYTKLAMETYHDDHIHDLPSSTSGYYTRDPLYANLVRTAIENGFTLIAYEDEGDYVNWNKRDSMQATNLINALAKTKDTGKVVLLGGHSHIHKYTGKPTQITLAMYYQQFTHTVPYCIDAEDGNRMKIDWAGSTAPFLLLKNDSLVNSRPERYDLQVHYPDAMLEPDSSHQAKINLADYHIKPADSSLLLLYNFNEYTRMKDIDKLLAVYVHFPAAPVFNVNLPTGKYLLAIYNRNDTLPITKEINIP